MTSLQNKEKQKQTESRKMLSRPWGLYEEEVGKTCLKERQRDGEGRNGWDCSRQSIRMKRLCKNSESIEEIQIQKVRVWDPRVTVMQSISTGETGGVVYFEDRWWVSVSKWNIRGDRVTFFVEMSNRVPEMMSHTQGKRTGSTVTEASSAAEISRGRRQTESRQDDSWEDTEHGRTQNPRRGVRRPRLINSLMLGESLHVLGP